MMSISIELGDTEYELTATSVDFGQAASWDDPGAGAEIELEDDVKVWGLVFKENGPGSGNGVPGVVEHIKLSDFLKIYAEAEELKESDALSHLEQYCIDDLAQQLGDDYDDRDL